LEVAGGDEWGESGSGVGVWGTESIGQKLYIEFLALLDSLVEIYG
jgi:hypothetical protein